MSYSAQTFHLIALLCTLTVEGMGMVLWARLFYPQPQRAIAIALVVNLVCHTLFWYSQPLFVGWWPIALYGGEFIVIVVEGASYAFLLHLRGITPWLLSFFLNAASFLAGLFLWTLLL